MSADAKKKKKKLATLPKGLFMELPKTVCSKDRNSDLSLYHAFKAGGKSFIEEAASTNNFFHFLHRENSSFF